MPKVVTAVFLLGILGLCYSLYRLQTASRESILTDREVARMLLFSLLFQKEIRVLSDNVISLSDGDGLRGFIERGDRVELARALRRAVFYSRQQPLYDRARFIDENGFERLRVNRNGVIVDDKELQNKAERPYFGRAFMLDRGQLYISTFDLSSDRGVLEVPHKPVLRLATPVFDTAGVKRGIYVINYLASESLASIQQMRSPVEHRFRVLNSGGYWLKSNVPDKEWAFVFPERKKGTLAEEDPALWRRICSEETGTAEYHGGLFNWKRLDLATCGSLSLARDQVCADEAFLVFASEVTASERSALGREERSVFFVLTAALLAATFVGSRQFFARRDANRALRRSEERLSVTLYSIGEAVVTTDMEGRITSMNRTAELVTGWPASEALGRPCGEVLQLIDEETQEPADVGVAEALATGSCSGADRALALVSRSGSRLSVLRSVARIQDKEQKRFLGAVLVIRDVSESRRLEKARVHFAERLEVANKELESFSYSVSHDLRAPLRHIQGYIDLFSREMQGRLTEKGQRYLNTIGNSARDMGTLIDDLLSFSRMGRAEMTETTVDPLELVEGVRRDLELARGCGAIEWRISRLPQVRGDRAMLRQVFANLLDNAVKYSRKKEHAVIEIDCVGEEGDRSVFRVRDNGAGFDMKYSDKLFGVFQRLHRADEFEGTGIGLANVQRIVKRHGGRVWAEGRLGEGASIYFTLTTAERAASQNSHETPKNPSR